MKPYLRKTLESQRVIIAVAQKIVATCVAELAEQGGLPAIPHVVDASMKLMEAAADLKKALDK